MRLQLRPHASTTAALAGLLLVGCGASTTTGNATEKTPLSTPVKLDHFDKTPSGTGEDILAWARWFASMAGTGGVVHAHPSDLYRVHRLVSDDRQPFSQSFFQNTSGSPATLQISTRATTPEMAALSADLACTAAFGFDLGAVLTKTQRLHNEALGLPCRYTKESKLMRTAAYGSSRAHLQIILSLEGQLVM